MVYLVRRPEAVGIGNTLVDVFEIDPSQGPRRARQVVERRGIAPEIVRKAVEGGFQEVDEAGLLRRHSTRKLCFPRTRGDVPRICPVGVCFNWTEQEVQRRRESAVVSHERPSCAVFVQIPLMLRI